MTDPADTSGTAQHTLPSNVLYNSRVEICHILQFLMSDRCPISAEIGTNQFFESRILFVDPGAGYFGVAYSANKSANSVFLSLPSLEFTANPHKGHLVFRVLSPTNIQFGGKPAIQFALPQSAILNHRREQPRISVHEDVSLRCIADDGGIISFEARIADLNLSGVGWMLYSADIMLEPGTILKGCRIIVPESQVIIADFEVRHTKIITSPDGVSLNRAGVRFVRKPEGIEALVDMLAQKQGNTAALG